MGEAYVKTLFSLKLSKLEHLRRDAKSRPLTMSEINLLMSMHFNGNPIFESIEMFYNEEYKTALSNGTSISELDKMQKFRPGTDAEVNMLYSDIHSREDKIEISSTASDH
jgi:hypothetical protein